MFNPTCIILRYRQSCWHSITILTILLHIFFPIPFTQLEQFLVSDLSYALSEDSLLESHPILFHVSNPDEINSLFDSITYSKVANSLFDSITYSKVASQHLFTMTSQLPLSSLVYMLTGFHSEKDVWLPLDLDTMTGMSKHTKLGAYPLKN